jgi:hypothetical protein
MMLLLLVNIHQGLQQLYLFFEYTLYECILAMQRILRDSSVSRGDRRLLIEIGRRALGLLIRDDGLLVRLVEMDLITMLNEDLAQ